MYLVALSLFNLNSLQKVKLQFLNNLTQASVLSEIVIIINYSHYLFMVKFIAFKTSAQ